MTAKSTTAMSFEQVYKTYHASVLKWLAYKIKSRNDAEELANDVFLKVFNHLQEFDCSKSALQTWVFNITNNTLIDYYRKNNITAKGQAKKNQQSTDECFGDESASPFQVPDNRTATADVLMDLQTVGKNTLQAINNLKGNNKALAVEFFVNQLSYDEIAEKLSLPMGTVKGTINRIRETLKAKLQPEYALLG